MSDTATITGLGQSTCVQSAARNAQQSMSLGARGLTGSCQGQRAVVKIMADTDGELTTVKCIAHGHRQVVVLMSGHVIGVVACARGEEHLDSKALGTVDWHPAARLTTCLTLLAIEYLQAGEYTENIIW